MVHKPGSLNARKHGEYWSVSASETNDLKMVYEVAIQISYEIYCAFDAQDFTFHARLTCADHDPAKRNWQEFDTWLLVSCISLQSFASLFI